MSTEGKTITCKGAVVWEFKKPISIETIEVDPPIKDEVRLKMIAVGFCHSDLVIMEGTFPSQPLPLVLGHEGAGIVESVGPEVTTLKKGDKVFTLCLPQCRNCRVCQFRRSNTCHDTKFGGGLMGRALMTDGTSRFRCKGKPVFHLLGASSFAEYTVIPEASAVKVSPQTNLDTACIMACAFPTGYGSSFNSVDIEPGDKTAVWGMGGVGLACLLGCTERKPSVNIAIDVNTEKENISKKFGSTHYISLDSIKKPVENIIKDLTKGEGLDFAFVCIGNIKAMESAAAALNAGGTLVVVGVASEAATMMISPATLVASQRIIGSLIGNYKVRDDIPLLVDKYNAGQLPIDDFITHRFTLEQINDAVDVMKKGKSIRSVIRIASEK